MPEPETKPAEATPAEQAYDAKAEVEALRETFTGELDSLKARNETLQDSLDTALEELALGGKSPSTEEAIQNREYIAPNTPMAAPAAPVADGNVPATDPPDALDNPAEKQIESAIREESEFREGVLQREEMRDLKEELRDALMKYPDADEAEVLLNIEDGIEENNPNQVALLAEESHLMHMSDRVSSETEIKEKVQEQVTKEAEGGISVPQSPGSPQTPAAPAAADTSKLGAEFDGDAAWGQALAAAKAEGTGV